MALGKPVFTSKNQCQSCFRCVQRCPVKAVSVVDGLAFIMHSRCISCGRCTLSCPSKTQQIRSDLDTVKDLIKSGGRVYASLAPEWRASFNCSERAIVSLLLSLGFAGVSESALGVEMVASNYAELMKTERSALISTACPVMVNYIKMYRPDLVKFLAPVESPVIAHARFLKETYGSDVRVVHISACAARKKESDDNPQMVASALTFAELRKWLSELTQPDLSLLEEDMECFVPQKATIGNLAPLDGGLRRIIRIKGVPTYQVIRTGTIPQFIQTVEGLDDTFEGPLFIDALACNGGCIAGPALASNQHGRLKNIASFLRSVPDDVKPADLPMAHAAAYEATPVHRNRWSEEELAGALRKLGRYNKQDQMNCGACGYPTCKALAGAILDGRAESYMCIASMHSLATRRAAAVLKGMPSAFVMMNQRMEILEVNDSFVTAFVGGESASEAKEKLIGQPIAPILDWTDMFRDVLLSGEEVYHEHYPYKGKYYEVRVFPLEKGQSVGAIIYDIATTTNRRDNISKKAREVISRNIAIVQEIACLLSEHVVETESLLSSIAGDLEDDGTGLKGSRN